MATRNAQSSAQRRKRVRFSGDDSSEPSVSDESALVATSTADDSTIASDFGSDDDSELSESSEDPSSESSSEEEEDDGNDSDVVMEEHRGEDGIVNLLANRGKKPVMKLDKDELGPDIRTFLKDFLPQLKAANEELEAQKKAGTLKSIEIGEEEGSDAEHHIEMDLGLGVLEDRSTTANDNAAGDGDGDGSDTDIADNENDVLGKLMGRNKRKNPAVVQEVRDAQPS